MIRYRKGGAPRVIRRDTPEPPFHAAAFVEPYSFPRTVPLAFDYTRLLATSVSRAQVQIASVDGADLGSRPVVIDSTGPAELVYRRGEAIHRLLLNRGVTTLQLISSDGWIPQIQTRRSSVALCAWPVDRELLDAIARELSGTGSNWGIAVPVAFPLTTDLTLLDEIADVAAQNGASFLIGVRLDLDPSARRAIAAIARPDDETYSTLFDQGQEAVSIATERHIAFLANQRKLGDSIQLEDETRSNWAAASQIATAGYRLLQMAEDVEMAWDFVRSARLVATLDKPLTRIASAANLGIIEGLPLPITEALEQWLESGKADLFNEIAQRWRLRRDYRA